MSHALRLLLVDDEAPARARLRDLLGDIAAEVPSIVVAEAADGFAALDRAQAGDLDVALIDIRMPGMDGVELARHLARLPTTPAVIFVTAFDQYAVQAFELAALDYLVKPVRAARLADALRKARRRADDAVRLEKLTLATPGRKSPGGIRQNLSCLERGRILLVPVADILYLKAEQKYVTARTAEREYLLEESLVHLEAEFSERFLRIHRNCLVARAAVTGVERAADAGDAEAHWQVILDGTAERLPVSRRLWPPVKALLKLAGQ
ncbi:MAG: LytTR family DNA-binding domain-containing protein [Sulfuritalea sp.]|nr:LytTR family DNA-binding domain-containing protein [Sulfuritalea sp.]